jgi:hypothetical protein
VIFILPIFGQARDLILPIFGQARDLIVPAMTPLRMRAEFPALASDSHFRRQKVFLFSCLGFHPDTPFRCSHWPGGEDEQEPTEALGFGSSSDIRILRIV